MGIPWNSLEILGKKPTFGLESSVNVIYTVMAAAEIRRIASNVETIAIEHINSMKDIFISHYIVPKNDVDQLVIELARLLTMKAIDYDINASIYSPSNVVDAAWHAILLSPKKYYDLCQTLLLHNIKDLKVLPNVVIDHDPNGGSYGRRERYENSLNRYTELFGELPNSMFWKSVDEETMQ